MMAFAASAMDLNLMPFVSVIVPNYNHARFLPERLNSVFQQDFDNYEVILLDDNSTDNSADVLASYASHPRVSHLILNESNSGSPFIQWQKGLELAKGEYIWLAESDDVAAPDFLSTLSACVQSEPDIAIAFARSYRIDEHGNNQGFNAWGEVIEPLRWNKPFINTGDNEIAHFLIHRNTIPNASAVLFRKDLGLQHITDIMNYRFCGDWLFWILLASHGKVAYRPDTFNYFRRYATATSLKRDKKRLDARFAEYNAVVKAAMDRKMPGASSLLQHDWMIDEWIANKQHMSVWDFLMPPFSSPLRKRFHKALFKRLIKR